MNAFEWRRLGGQIAGAVGTAGVVALLAYVLPLSPPKAPRKPQAANAALDVPLLPDAPGTRTFLPTGELDRPSSTPTTRSKNGVAESVEVETPMSGIRSFASASALFVNNIETGFDDIFTERAIFGQSAAAVATDGSPLANLDEFGNRILRNLPLGATAFGHGAGMSALGDATGLPNALRADATSPVGNRNHSNFLAGTSYPPLTFRGITANALANTNLRGACTSEASLADGMGSIAEVSVLDTRGGVPGGSRTLALDGAVESRSVTRYAKAQTPTGKTISPAVTGLSTSMIVRVPTVSLMPDTPNAVSITVLAPIRVDIGVGGVANSVWARWQPVGVTGNDDLIEVKVGQQRFRLPTPSSKESDLIGHFQFVTDHATVASVRFNLLDLSPPGLDELVERLGTKQPLVKLLADALDKALEPLRATDTAPEGLPALRRISLGHFEARLQVRSGGLACPAP